ncbi:MAG: RNA methyltransferase [Oscillospiraceae bacterium]|jgi:TrmH family RNA methyltransferase|nr:RNA methyltransferase [Oscillospiraceae bacterium]
MEHITSRQNGIIAHLRRLASDGAYRRETGEFACDGEKMLREALAFGAELNCVLWGGEPKFALPAQFSQYTCPEALMRYASPLRNSAGPVFSVKIRALPNKTAVSSVIVLENVQDPGNVGTVIRTADALGTDAVLLVGDCADLHNPKTVRATMGGIFRQAVIETGLDGLKNYVNQNKLTLYGAALSGDSADIRDVRPVRAAVAVGSEGRGLSSALLALCERRLVIPMRSGCESLNAAVAAAIIMWEMSRRE